MTSASARVTLSSIDAVGEESFSSVALEVVAEESLSTTKLDGGPESDARVGGMDGIESVRSCSALTLAVLELAVVSELTAVVELATCALLLRPSLSTGPAGAAPVAAACEGAESDVCRPKEWNDAPSSIATDWREFWALDTFSARLLHSSGADGELNINVQEQRGK